jgi:hypothetical protein
MSANADYEQNKLDEIVRVLKKRFGITCLVQVEVVPHNPLGFSVQPTDTRKFVLQVDTNFLRLLNNEELTAALAHELAHVWIYTHHPFLHTETLANQIAMQVVSRDSLEDLYVKVWSFYGDRGTVHEPLVPVVSAAGGSSCCPHGVKIRLKRRNHWSVPDEHRVLIVIRALLGPFAKGTVKDAIRNRHRPIAHQRCIYASLMLATPTPGRAGFILGVGLLGLTAVPLFAIVCAIFDRRTLGKVHPSTKLCLVATVGHAIVPLGLSALDPIVQFVVSLGW